MIKYLILRIFTISNIGRNDAMSTIISFVDSIGCWKNLSPFCARMLLFDRTIFRRRFLGGDVEFNSHSCVLNSIGKSILFIFKCASFLQTEFLNSVCILLHRDSPLNGLLKFNCRHLRTLAGDCGTHICWILSWMLLLRSPLVTNYSKQMQTACVGVCDDLQTAINNHCTFPFQSITMWLWSTLIISVIKKQVRTLINIAWSSCGRFQTWRIIKWC